MIAGLRRAEEIVQEKYSFWLQMAKRAKNGEQTKYPYEECMIRANTLANVIHELGNELAKL